MLLGKQWWRDFRPDRRWHGYLLQLTSLEASTRRLATFGLSVLAMAAGALLLAWYGAEDARAVGIEPGAGALSWVVPIVAVLALATGMPLTAAAVTCAGWRWAPHSTVALAGLTTLSLIGNLGLNAVAVDSAHLLVRVTSRLLLWSALLALWVVATLVSRGRAPQPVIVGAAFALPWLAMAGAVVLRGATVGWSTSVSGAVVWGLRLLELLPVLALGGLLVGLAVDGLRLFRDVGVGALGRTRSRRPLLFGLLVTKALLLGLVALTQGPTATERGLGLSVRGFLLAIPLVLAVLALLAGEERLGLVEKHFGQAVLVYAVLVSTWLALLFVSVTVLATVFLLRLRIEILLGIVGLAVALPLLTSRMQQHRVRSRRAAFAVGVLVLVCVAPLLPGLDRVLEELSGAQPSGDLPDEVTAALIIAGALLPVAALLLALVLRRLVRPVLLVLGAVSFALIALALQVEPLSLELALTVGIAVVALAPVPASRRHLPVEELILLAVVPTIVIWSPLVSGLLPKGVAAVLAPLAFLVPVLSRFTMDAAVLNRPGADRGARVLATTGICCTTLGLAVLQVAVNGQDDIILWFVKGLSVALVPLSIALVAVSAAQFRQEPAAAPRMSSG